MSLKARLLFVSWIKVDGKLVYKAEPKPTDADDRDERDVRNTDVPATSAEPQAATPEPSRPAAEAADEAAADAPHWKLPSRSDPQGPVPWGLVFFPLASACDRRHDGRARDRGFVRRSSS